MSRPLLPLFSLSLAVLLSSFAGCRTGTIYDRTYSPERSYFKAPPKKVEAPAELLLGPAPAANMPAELPPPAVPPTVPGL